MTSSCCARRVLPNQEGKTGAKGILRASRRNGLVNLESKGSDGDDGAERDGGGGEADGERAVAAAEDTRVRGTDNGRTAAGRRSGRSGGGRGGGVDNKANKTQDIKHAARSKTKTARTYVVPEAADAEAEPEADAELEELARQDVLSLFWTVIWNNEGRRVTKTLRTLRSKFSSV